LKRSTGSRDRAACTPSTRGDATVTGVPNEIRRSLVASLVEQHMDRQRATIAVDLAAQACDQAREAFNRTVKSAPDATMALCVTHIAAQILTVQMDGLAEGAERLGQAFSIPHLHRSKHHG
jgi:hypothetical protein